MARHRSAHDAADPGRTVVTAPAALPRLPPLPASCGRMTIAAVVAGATIAAGESVVGALDGPPLPVSAVLPVTEVDEPLPRGIDGEQPHSAPPTPADLDPQAQVDVHNLAKAMDIGRELARQATILDAALSDGAPEAALVGDNVFVRPVTGRLTSMVGPRWGTRHNGLDIANRIGTPIFAATDGVVVESGPASGFGLWVVLRHSDGTRSVYGHINRTFVEVGQRVAAGDQIAELGNRGFSTGPHLHIEIWDDDGRRLDPARWFRRHGIDL